MKVYADHAATTKIDALALEAMRPYLQDEYGNASQLYSFARGAKAALKEGRERIASCIGATPEEIFFTSGGTESDNWAIKGSAFSDVNKGTIITSAFEHHAVLRSCEFVERLGYPVTYLKPTNDGVITPSCLAHVITDQTHLVSIMYANNELGSIQPISELASVAHQYGAIFHTDAVQAVGHIPIDVKQLDVDMLSASAHKFNGPKGIGFLYIKSGTTILPYLDGGSQEHSYRAGTENIANIVGMSVALKTCCEAMSCRTAHLNRLEEVLLSKLKQSRLDFRINTGEEHLPGIVSLSFRGADGEVILHRLDLLGVSISTGSACNSESSELSHVLKAIELPLDYAYGTVRISLGYENTVDEVCYIADCLQKIISP